MAIETLQDGRLGIELDFDNQQEHWNYYKLLDGGRIKSKTTILKIYKIVDTEGNQIKDDNGNLVFQAMHKTDIVHSI